MSRTLMTGVVLAMLSSTIAADAQVGLGLAAGPSFPRGDFGQVTNSGYHVTGMVTLSVPLVPVGFRGEGAFSQYDYKSTLGARDVQARILYATANAVLSSPGFLGPYLIGGVGIYRATAECSTCTTSSTKGGVNGGVGFKLGLSGFSVFVEARYHYIGGASDPTTGGVKSSTQFIPVSVGITF